MKPTDIRDATHKFDAPSNWDAEKNGECGSLFVRADLVGENKVVELCSCWKPNANELDMLIAGGVVEIGLCTPNHPVTRVSVVEPFVPEEKPSTPITINEHAHGDDYGA